MEVWLTEGHCDRRFFTHLERYGCLVGRNPYAPARTALVSMHGEDKPRGLSELPGSRFVRQHDVIVIRFALNGIDLIEFHAIHVALHIGDQCG